MHLLLVIAALLASATVDAANLLDGGIEFQQRGTELYLHSQQANLAKILTEITAKTGVRIHYSVLPETPVSSTCIGTSVKVVLQCLLGDKVDMAFRHPGGIKDSHTQSQEVWLLGSSLADADAGVCQKLAARKNVQPESLTQMPQEAGEPSAEEKLVFRKQMAISNDPQARAQAIAYLASHTSPEDKEFRQILDAALKDDNAEIKAQALTSLVAWEGEEAAMSEIQQLLSDSDENMRLMALQLVTDNSLIQRAMQDESSKVRHYAAVKLQSK
jgi:hypothetical protein